MQKNIIRFLALCFLLVLSSLFAACQAQPTVGSTSIALNSTSTTSPTAHPTSTTSPTAHPTSTTSPINPTNINCPAAGQARAMDLSTTFEQADPTIVYQYTQVAANQTSLKSYDVQTGTKNDIYAAPAGETVSNPMLSADGKWVLFVSYSTNGGAAQGDEKIQAIGTNGQGLQTLYCTDGKHGMGNVEWSPDMAHIAFISASYANSSIQQDGIYLLDTANGTIQTLLSGTTYTPVAWYDATHLYISQTKAGTGTSAQELYLLAITGGANQVQTVFANPQNMHWNTTLSPDGQRLSISEMSGPDGGPATILVQPATGGQATSIYRNQAQGITEVCSASDNTLLVSVSRSHTMTNNDNAGLYRMNASGTEPVKLFPLQGNNDSVVAGCMYSWQTVSRDSSLYAFADTDTQSQKLYVGKLYAGGQPTLFADTGTLTDAVTLVGWTTW